jgi:hypothetical protein
MESTQAPDISLFGLTVDSNVEEVQEVVTKILEEGVGHPIHAFDRDVTGVLDLDQREKTAIIESVTNEVKNALTEVKKATEEPCEIVRGKINRGKIKLNKGPFSGMQLTGLHSIIKGGDQIVQGVSLSEEVTFLGRDAGTIGKIGIETSHPSQDQEVNARIWHITPPSTA